MNPNENWDEERMAELLALAGKDAPPPDEDFLRRLGERSAEEFAAQSSPEAVASRAGAASQPTTTAAGAPPQPTTTTTPLPERRRRMVFLIRGLAAALAASILLVATLWNGPSVSGAAPPLGKVLDQVAAADTLHLKITRDGKTGDVWVRRPQQLRWNEPDGTYRIAREGRVWQVDEKANRATSQPAAYFRGEPAGLDALALLDISLDKENRAAISGLQPAERIQRDGLDCYVYRCRVPWKQTHVQVEALVDAGTQFLQSLEAKTERDGRVPSGWEPLSRLTVVARGEPVGEDLFVVGSTLTEDGRIGKVTDAQGMVSVKPVMRERWTPVDGRLLVMPGDWLRTDPRGANAVTVRLVPQTDVTLGPGSLVEMATPRQLRISSGELKIATAAKAPIELIGPGQQKITVEGTAIYRVTGEKSGEKLVRLEQAPLWLRGYEGQTANESIGALVAKVDGRDVPLTVGFHRVTVDVRDQIARTVVEESFVNNTGSRLEGVFHFPLPQDASISGFGMWIGNTLVEADIVEKQRAREIYETILREKRDPGLLEWTGGNIFKARVFPIEAHSEKRIRISYTQVLPLRGSSYRYQYALQSELLKQHPLRELSIDVKINSEVPLKSVTCPTHTVRSDMTARSAHVEFTAQQYTPTRDFEVVVQIDRRQADVVMIPHRRGEDGYFMVQLTPPAANGNWQRELVSDGEPLELLLLADTSASMDRDSRAKQTEVIAAILSSLGPKDRFNLAVCDVDCRFAFEKAMPAEEKYVAAARQLLAERVSLGWTDLDKAFASALTRCGLKTHVIYLGDGIVTTGDQDPVAFSKRLRRLYEKAESGRRKADTKAETPPSAFRFPLSAFSPTFHAVALGSSFEPAVMKTIASLGGGSFRQITGERGPTTVAKELLAEIAQPGLRDIKVEFRGLKTARVYPDELPNVPLGSQQILLGRYLPQGADQTGEVIVTGTQAGKPVRFSRKVSLKDAEQGNSFIPRLWARMHLDVLLQQGASQGVIDDIIALSEEYNIITPYTSMLVLESDADRERFKVKPRFRMRDGEKFFAEGRANVNFDLVQQQMRRAGNWRIGMRRAVLQQLGGLGRDAGIFQQPAYGNRQWFYGLEMRSPVGSAGGGYGGSGERRLAGLSSDSSIGGQPVDFESNLSLGISSTQSLEGFDLSGEVDADSPMGSRDAKYASAKKAEVAEELGEQLAREDGLNRFNKDLFDEGALGPMDKLLPMEQAEPMAAARPARSRSSLAAGNEPFFVRGNYVIGKPIWMTDDFSVSGTLSRRGIGGGYDPGGQWLSGLFPQVPAPPRKPKEPKKPWPEPARDLARSLLRTDQVLGFKDGLQIQRQSESFDARWGELTSRSRTLTLVAPARWLIRSEGDAAQTNVSWCDGKVRGAFGTAFQLGSQRAVVGQASSLSKPEDLAMPPVQLIGFAMEPLDRTYQDYVPELKPQDGNRMLLVLRNPRQRGYESHILIDTPRKVILSMEGRQDGKVTSTTRFDDFVEVGGAWYAGRSETLDDKGRRVSLVIEKFQPLGAGQLDRQWKDELAPAAQVQFLHAPLPRLVDAKKAIAAGKATFEDQVVMASHFERSQQWARVMDHWQKAEQLAAGKPGVRWARYALLGVSRRREELKTRIMEEAAQLARTPVGRLSKSPHSLDDQLFLAQHLLSQSGGGEPNEMLALLDAIKPMVERGPAHVAGMRNWQDSRAGYLQSTGQWDQALALRRQLAEQYPHNASVQQQYARALADARDFDAAYAWIAKVLGPDARWLPYEEESLRNVVCDFMRQQGCYPELVDYLAGWVKLSPESESPYRQYLAALVFADRLEEADATAARWLAEGQTPQKLTPDTLGRLRAAVNYALGQGYNYNRDRMDPKWHNPLAEAVLVLARKDESLFAAREIMNSGHFRDSDECRRVRKAVAKVLRDELAKPRGTGILPVLSVDQIAAFVEWISPNDPAVEPELWKQIAAGLRERWSAEVDADKKNQIAGTLVGVLSGHATPAELLEFLRTQLEKGPKDNRATYAMQLFNTLLSQPWSADYENEAFGLLERLSDSEEPAERLWAQIAALYRMTDRMVQARFDARMKTIEHQEKLTRTELAAKRAENQKAAREGFADRLHEEARKRQPPLSRWMTIERVYLDILVNRNLDQAEGECWELLGSGESRVESRELDSSLSVVDSQLSALNSQLSTRCLVTLLNLAARKTAKPPSVDRLVQYLDKAIAADAEDIRWRLFKVQLLIALDRPKDLQQALEDWIKVGDAGNRWRQALAYLLAEQGRLDQAIKLFEAIREADELGPTDYRALADWYMAVGRKDEYRQAMIAVYKTVQEWQLSNWLSNKLNPWRRSDRTPTSQLDEEVLLVFAALFEKASNPQNHLHNLAEFYRLTRDFRLLEGLADAVIGHTAGRVYPFLQGMDQVLREIQDEATADSLVERIAKVRQRAETDKVGRLSKSSHVDQRALDLLEVLVERRAAELKNQPGPHGQRALAAMQRAFNRSWTPGEPRLVADLLSGLGTIAYKPLADEQVRELEVLHQQAAAGSIDRLHIAHALARSYWAYGQQDRAIDLLESSLAEYQAAQGGVLPVAANGPLGTFVSYLQDRRFFARGEKYLQEQLKHPAGKQQVFWLVEQLYELYRRAIQDDGDVSLGSGLTLYRAVENKLRADLDAGDENHRHALVNRLLSVYRAAHSRKLPGAIDDLKAFAAKRFPEALKRQTNNYQSLVREVANTVYELAGHRDGLAALIALVEQEPRWLQYSGQDAWNWHGHTLAEWRYKLQQEGGRLGDLEGRLLKIVLAELRRDLESRRNRNMSIYWEGNQYFWAEKRQDFINTAEEVLARNKDSGAAVAYITNHMYRGFGQHKRAVDILLDANRREILDEAGQSQLVQFAQDQGRYAETIPVLEPLVQRRADNVQYHVWLLRAYWGTKQQAKLLDQLKKTDAYFHQQGRWQESAMAALARSCLDNRLYEQSVAYYKELIPLHERTQPNRGIGNWTLSNYYADQARAYAGLGKTAEAVDAACGAVVSSRRDQRAQALRSLHDVLSDARDLDDYVVQFDKETAATAQDKPIVRKALGQVYLEKGQFAKAIAQLNLAVRLQPNDAETYKALIDCYDKQEDRDGAIRQVLRSLELLRRDIERYKDLGNRLEKIGRPEEAQRAYTSIVEVLPNESEGQAMLAELRQQQNRWNDAIVCWEQVARIRALEPTGLLRLAAAQIHEKRWDDAAATLQKLRSRPWPGRFANDLQQVRNLERQVEEKR